MHALVLVEMLSLLEGFIAIGALVGLLTRVHPPVALQVRSVLEALLAVRTFEWLLPGRVTAVLHEFRGRKKAALTQGATQRLLCGGAVRQLVLLQGRCPLVGLVTHGAFEGPLCGSWQALVPQQLGRLVEALLAHRALEQSLQGVHVLVVEQVAGLAEALLAQATLKGFFRLVCAPVAHQCVLLLEAHGAQIALEGPLRTVGALVLPQVRRPLEGLLALAAAKRPLTTRGTGVLQQLGRLLEMQLAHVAAEEVVLPRMCIHVAHQVGAVLEGLLTDGALVGPLGAVCALVVHEVRGLTEALVTQRALIRLLSRVDPLMSGELR